MPKVDVTVKIGGVEMEREQNSLKVYDAIEMRSTASVTITDRINALTFQRGQEVEAYMETPDLLYQWPSGFLVTYTNGASYYNAAAEVSNGGVASLSLMGPIGDGHWVIINKKGAKICALNIIVAGVQDWPAAMRIHIRWGGAWHPVAGLVDGTEVGGCTLAQSGRVYWTLHDDQDGYAAGGASGYLVRMSFSGHVHFIGIATCQLECQEFDLFHGIVFTPAKHVEPNSTLANHTLECVDWHYLADKRRVAKTYATPQTAKYIIEDIITDYLAAEGIIIGEIQTGPVIEQMIINYQSPSAVFDALAEKAGYIWYIDPYKALYFVERTTTPAPFDVTTNETRRFFSSLEQKSDMYRNRQYIRAGRGLTSEQIETFTGDGVTVSFTVGYPISKVPVVTVNAVGQNVGIKGLDVGKDCYWSKGDPVIVFDAAPAAVAVVITYYGEYSIMVVVEDAAEIAARQAIEGGTGIVETIDDEPDLVSVVDAAMSGEAKLTHFGVIGKQFNFTVWDWGLSPGQLVSVTYAEYGLTAENLLIESVDIEEASPGFLAYRVKATSGPEVGDWTGFFKTLASAKEDIIRRMNVGSEGILIILAEVDGGWGWYEHVDFTVT